MFKLIFVALLRDTQQNLLCELWKLLVICKLFQEIAACSWNVTFVKSFLINLRCFNKACLFGTVVKVGVVDDFRCLILHERSISFWIIISSPQEQSIEPPLSFWNPKPLFEVRLAVELNAWRPPFYTSLSIKVKQIAATRRNLLMVFVLFRPTRIVSNWSTSRISFLLKYFCSAPRKRNIIIIGNWWVMY